MLVPHPLTIPSFEEREVMGLTFNEVGCQTPQWWEGNLEEENLCCTRTESKKSKY